MEFLYNVGLAKRPDPAEEAKKWKREISRQQRQIDRELSALKREENKMLKECKRLAEKGHTSGAKITAKNVVQVRSTMDRLRVAKTQMGSVSMQLQTQVAMIKVSGCMQKSGEVMKSMSKLMNIRDLRETMTTMAREMERAGLIDDMIGDTFEAIEDPGTEEAAEEEVNRVLLELTGQVMDDLGAEATPTPLPTKDAEAEAAEEAKTDAADAELDAMEARLNAL